MTEPSCKGITELDLTGLDPSKLTDLLYAFASCPAFTTIYVDNTWELPSGASGMGCFYQDTAFVGGNGTAYSSSKYGASMCVIDKEGQKSYLTAK